MNTLDPTHLQVGDTITLQSGRGGTVTSDVMQHSSGRYTVWVALATGPERVVCDAVTQVVRGGAVVWEADNLPDGMKKCPVCNGSGMAVYSQGDSNPVDDYYQGKCYMCAGSGTVEKGQA